MEEISAARDAPDLSPSTHEEKAQISTSETGKPPLLSFAMLRRAMGVQIFYLDKNELSARAYKGVLLKDDKELGEAKNIEDGGLPSTRKYWVDKKLNKNRWMFLAKELIPSDDEHWQWIEEEEPCYSGNEKMHIAELRRICWLEINGKCNTIMLSPWTTYEVEILVKMRERSRGWDAPVNLSLALPDGNKQERMERLEGLEKEKWHAISIGQFETTPKTVGKISFSLKQTDGNWKTKLCVKAIVLRPTT
ncbi:uncharacterized protein PHLOEM PROTEIN 2-LIKE A4 [Eucalyptus grandis]|uniref:uncharacterized protein PHLOEM PROTEIN 2-LIKE A4 n=1 Tax=Eucalyptus grandis TaxID=71139 RepID=UPI00192ED667|nr:uncharacterized protein PHLOEM PROTEIN 2-LIKE A4 [Eucalyptus grandis]